MGGEIKSWKVHKGINEIYFGDGFGKSFLQCRRQIGISNFPVLPCMGFLKMVLSEVSAKEKKKTDLPTDRHVLSVTHHLCVRVCLRGWIAQRFILFRHQ